MADVGRWKVGSPQTASCCGCFLTQILREGAAGAMECSRAGWRGGLWYVAGARCAGRGLSQDVHGCCCGSPQIPAWLPRAPLVNERSLAVCLWASFSPLGSQFPFCRRGALTCCHQLLLPPSPSWELQEPVPMASLATKTPKQGLARLEEAGGQAALPCPLPMGVVLPAPLLAPGAPLVTQASWKRRGRATRIPRHPTQSSRSDRLCVPSPPHRYLRWAPRAVCSVPAPSGRPFLLLPLAPSGHRLLVLGQAPPPPLPGPGPAKPNISSPFISPWAQLLGPLLAFTSLWLAAQRPICWELPCGAQGVPGGARGSPW